MKRNKDDIAVLMFLDNFPREKNAALHNEIVMALYAKYPNHQLVKERYAVETSPATATSVGAIAPDLAFPDPDGNIRKLSNAKCLRPSRSIDSRFIEHHFYFIFIQSLRSCPRIEQRLAPFPKARFDAREKQFFVF